MIARGHELGIDVFASFRVNDNHFNGALTPAEVRPTSSRTIEALRCAEDGIAKDI